MHRKTRIKMTDLNPLLTCTLCKGYLVDATTLTECLHSFCRSCLVRYLCTSTQCPTCDTTIHKTRPLLNARVDRALQNIVYKLTPGLFKDEMKKRRDFYAENASADDIVTNMEDRGEVSEQSVIIYSDDETMTLSLEYYAPNQQPSATWATNQNRTKRSYHGDSQTHYSADEDEIIDKRYLRCPAAVCVKHIKKFIRNKFDLKPSYEVEVTHFDDEDDCLPDDYTLMDVAYIYAWHRTGPLPLVFRVFHKNKKQRTDLHEMSEEKRNRLSVKHLTSEEEQPPCLQKECDLIKDGKATDETFSRITFDPSSKEDDSQMTKEDEKSPMKERMKEEEEEEEEEFARGKLKDIDSKRTNVDFHREELEPSDKEKSETPPTLTRIETT